AGGGGERRRGAVGRAGPRHRAGGILARSIGDPGAADRARLPARAGPAAAVARQDAYAAANPARRLQRRSVGRPFRGASESEPYRCASRLRNDIPDARTGGGPMRAWLPMTFAVLAVTVSAQDAVTSGSLERPFRANGSVKMDLVAGDYRITGTAEERVRLDWSVRDAAALAKVQARADVRDNQLSITTDGPSNRGLKFVIQVPNQSDLHVRLTAGDLTIEDVRGNKDVELRAG